MLTDRRPLLLLRPRMCGESGRTIPDAWTCFVVIMFVTIFTNGIVNCRPVIGKEKSKKVDGVTMSNAIDFLTKYGYLEQSDLQTGNLRTDEQLQEAIKTMQRFGHIPETGVIDEATVKLMKKSRCGVPDMVGTSERVRRYALQGAKWEKHDLTWSIHELPEDDISYNDVRRDLTNAFKIWSDASRLSFRELARGSEADIIISFYRGYHGDGYSFDGPGSVLAHAFFPGGGIGGDTHFDDDEEWGAGSSANKDSTAVSLFAVAAHEFGHSLGLSHSGDQSALMYPYYQWFGQDYTLPDDDRMGIEQLYGPKFQRPWATLPAIFTRPPHVPVTRHPTHPTHPPRQPPTQPSREVPSGKPKTCETSYDAISVIRKELFIFKDNYFWRLNDQGLSQMYPVEISRFWYNLPPDIKKIDAIYERPRDRKIIFFIGKNFWVFNANHPDKDQPQPLTKLGLPPTVEKIDAAMVWGHNGKTYFFSGQEYWRFDEAEGRVELDYPRNMNMWRGVPYNIDAAFQWNDGKTYFFKGHHYWKFNDQKMKVENKHPLPSAPFWMSCPDSSKHPDTEDGAKELPQIGDRDTSDSVRVALSTQWTILLIAVMTSFYINL